MEGTLTRHCAAITADGTPCEARPVVNGDLCFFHNPASASARDAARRLGGQERNRRAAVLAADTPDRPLISVADVIALLGDTINQVRRGELDPRVANCVGYLAAPLLRALEQGHLEVRLATLEAVMRRAASVDPDRPSFTFENPSACAR